MVTYLMLGEDQRVGNDDILRPGRSEDDHLGNVLGRQRVDAAEQLASIHTREYFRRGSDLRINGIRLGLVAVEADNRELRLDLAGVDLNHTHARGNQLLAQALGEAADGSLGGAVDASAGVGVEAGNAADVDNVAGTAVGAALEEGGQDSLGHVDEAGDVGSKHDVDVLLGDFRGTSNALDEATVCVSTSLPAERGSG